MVKDIKLSKQSLWYKEDTSFRFLTLCDLFQSRVNMCIEHEQQMYLCFFVLMKKFKKIVGNLNQISFSFSEALFGYSYHAILIIAIDRLILQMSNRKFVQLYYQVQSIMFFFSKFWLKSNYQKLFFVSLVVPSGSN